jgi:hypothetical protein
VTHRAVRPGLAWIRKTLVNDAHVAPTAIDVEIFSAKTVIVIRPLISASKKLDADFTRVLASLAHKFDFHCAIVRPFFEIIFRISRCE